MQIFDFLCLSSLFLLVQSSAHGSANKCKQSYGYVSTRRLTNTSCPITGENLTFSLKFNWNDGSYSDIMFEFYTQLAIGSCCSQLRYSYYGTGVVTDGRFDGENVIWVTNSHSVRQSCNGSLGRTLVDRTSLLSIGTKGVGKWIECVGNGTVVYSPALTYVEQPVHTKFTENFVCNDCVESC